jgi:hypothetical protein
MDNIHIHINHLIDKLYISSNPVQHLDIVFEGGLFNGSYLLGILYYLNELEKKRYILIDRFSACSVGSIITLLYYSKAYHLTDIIYKITYSHFKKCLNINIFGKLFKKIRPFLTDEIMQKINGNLYITYYNIKTNTQIIKNTYSNVDDLFDTIHKSCFFPYIVDKSFVYKNKYVDGFHPYIFPESTTPNKKILYLNIHTIDKMFNMFSIKHEPHNYNRILEGIIDIHIFFMNNNSTSICSYVNDWTIIETMQNYMYVFILKLIPYFMHNMYLLNKIVESICYNDSSNKITTDNNINIYYKIPHIIYLFIIKRFCI